MTSISNITEVPSDLITLIGEFSANVDFLPAVSEKLTKEGLDDEAKKISTLAAELAPGFAIASLLQEELAISEDTDLQEKSTALKDLVDKYTNIAVSHRLFGSLERVKGIFEEINRIIDTIPNNEIKLCAQSCIIAARLILSGNAQEAIEAAEAVVNPISRSSTLRAIAENYREVDMEDASGIADLIGS
ncbi:MAG: hypothetical protein COT84_03055 [Chlamydiae bacterium CG10_big_fil_rev_8_21_14_0_10_35_9]|nr:MAG: hypothetical protein COT84_03055 [Chlamydiae bacterium CG10_big_fil_rev_8_21_14_0_10_35_9]